MVASDELTLSVTTRLTLPSHTRRQSITLLRPFRLFRQTSPKTRFLKVYMELGSYFLFLQEQIKDIIITKLDCIPLVTTTLN
jgi:hypothetical protein